VEETQVKTNMDHYLNLASKKIKKHQILCQYIGAPKSSIKINVPYIVWLKSMEETKI